MGKRLLPKHLSYYTHIDERSALVYISGGCPEALGDTNKAEMKITDRLDDMRWD